MSNVKIKTRCYYTDYVNHMIRFYLSIPNGMDLNAKAYTNVDVDNWLAVQLVFSRLSQDDLNRVRDVFRISFNLPKAVDEYAQEKQVPVEEVWRTITKVTAKIARVRGLK